MNNPTKLLAVLEVNEQVEESHLFEVVKNKVEQLLIFKPQKLQQILYLLDVPEQEFIRAISLPDASMAASKIAQAIMRREREKAKSRGE